MLFYNLIKYNYLINFYRIEKTTINNIFYKSKLPTLSFINEQFLIFAITKSIPMIMLNKNFIYSGIFLFIAIGFLNAQKKPHLDKKKPTEVGFT